MSTVYELLKTLRITLPDVQPPVVDGYVAAFVPFVRTGNVIYISGRVAKKDGKPWAGKLGENITTEEGKQTARAGLGGYNYSAVKAASIHLMCREKLPLSTPDSLDV